MTTGKKFLSILLSLCLLLSFGTLAFAEGETPDYHWQPIPTSTEGLTEGDLYLDLSWFFFSMILSGANMEDAAATFAMLESGTWLYDARRRRTDRGS